MPSPMRTMLQNIRDFFSAVTGQENSPGETAPDVVLHDPAAQGPHDLDDPYFDETVQKRFADVIASSVQEKG
jgi:hypothetical protein